MLYITPRMRKKLTKYESYLKLHQIDNFQHNFDADNRLHIYSSCLFCGIFTELTKDHIVPRAFRGSNGPENIAMVCKNCNQLKGDRTLEEWVRDMPVNTKYRLAIEYILQQGINGSFKPIQYESNDYYVA